jgi:DNA-directed RNA polymerase specialized sigma24 family protein
MQIKDKYYKSTESLLYNYNMLKVSIENMKLEIEETKKEDGMTAIEYSDEKTSPTFKITSQTEDTAIRNIEHTDLLRKRIEITQNKITRLDNAINGLNKNERDVIIKRYIEGKQWYIVAYEVNYNERWCKELRKRAIERLTIGLYGYTALLEHESKESMC